MRWIKLSTSVREWKHRIQTRWNVLHLGIFPYTYHCSYGCSACGASPILIDHSTRDKFDALTFNLALQIPFFILFYLSSGKFKFIRCRNIRYSWNSNFIFFCLFFIWTFIFWSSVSSYISLYNLIIFRTHSEIIKVYPIKSFIPVWAHSSNISPTSFTFIHNPRHYFCDSFFRNTYYLLTSLFNRQGIPIKAYRLVFLVNRELNYFYYKCRQVFLCFYFP